MQDYSGLAQFENRKIKVLKFKGSTNPIVFYNKSGAN